MDEIVEIFTIYSRKQDFELVLPDSGYRTWYEAAVARIEEWDEEPMLPDDRDPGINSDRGHSSPESRDGSHKGTQSSCLKKKHKWSPSQSSALLQANRDSVDAEGGAYHGRHRQSLPHRDMITSTPTWPSKRSSVRLGRAPVAMITVFASKDCSSVATV